MEDDAAVLDTMSTLGGGQEIPFKSNPLNLLALKASSFSLSKRACSFDRPASESVDKARRESEGWEAEVGSGWARRLIRLLYTWVSTPFGI